MLSWQPRCSCRAPERESFPAEPWTGSWCGGGGESGTGREGSGRGRAQRHRSLLFASDHSYDFSPPWMDTIQRHRSPDLHTQSGETLKSFSVPKNRCTSGKAELRSQLLRGGRGGSWSSSRCCVFPAGEQIPGVKSESKHHGIRDGGRDGSSESSRSLGQAVATLRRAACAMRAQGEGCKRQFRSRKNSQTKYF